MSNQAYKSASDLTDDVRDALGSLLLVLADNKRILGIRYADWILGAPSVEAGIACSAMAQDEWGHGRIVYAMLKDFGHDPAGLEHERDAKAYRSSELLDADIAAWPDLLAVNLLLDTALSVQFEAMESSRFEPMHYKARKLLDEERFHFEHARGWVARLSMADRGRQALSEAIGRAWPICLAWFGSDDDGIGTTLHEAGVTDRGPAALRSRWLERVRPVLQQGGLELPATAEAAGSDFSAPEDWSERRRRLAGGGPDQRTLERVRGDRNRALLMD